MPAKAGEPTQPGAETQTEESAQVQQGTNEDTDAAQTEGQGEPQFDVETQVPEKFHVRDDEGNLDERATMAKLAQSYSHLERLNSQTQTRYTQFLQQMAETPSQQPVAQPPATAEQQALEDTYLARIEQVNSNPSLTPQQKKAQSLKLFGEYSRESARLSSQPEQQQPAGPSPQDIARKEHERVQLALHVPYYRENLEEVNWLIQEGEKTGHFGPGATERDKVATMMAYHRALVEQVEAQAQSAGQNIEQDIRQQLRTTAAAPGSSSRRGPAPKPQKRSEEDEIWERMRASGLRVN